MVAKEQSAPPWQLQYSADHCNLDATVSLKKRRVRGGGTWPSRARDGSLLTWLRGLVGGILRACRRGKIQGAKQHKFRARRNKIQGAKQHQTYPETGGGKHRLLHLHRASAGNDRPNVPPGGGAPKIFAQKLLSPPSRTCGPRERATWSVSGLGPSVGASLAAAIARICMGALTLARGASYECARKQASAR